MWNVTPPQNRIESRSWAESNAVTTNAVEAGAKAVLLHALSLLAAAGVTPADAARQLRAGKTLETICERRILTSEERQRVGDIAQDLLSRVQAPDDGEESPCSGSPEALARIGKVHPSDIPRLLAGSAEREAGREAIKNYISKCVDHQPEPGAYGICQRCGAEIV